MVLWWFANIKNSSSVPAKNELLGGWWNNSLRTSSRARGLCLFFCFLFFGAGEGVGGGKKTRACSDVSEI